MLSAALIVALAVTGPDCNCSQDRRVYQPVDTAVTRIDSGGSWAERGRRGRYRAVVQARCSPESCHDDLYVEWIETTAGAKGASPGAKLAATRHIDEVGGLTNISQLHYVQLRSGTHLEVTHASLDSQESWTLCLKLGGPERYTSQQGRCARS
jgi:hypothetical protein